ncbi:MAG: protein kinase domain-containing protein [Nostocoides sp.]
MSIGEVIAHGSLATVWSGVDHNGSPVAVKILPEPVQPSAGLPEGAEDGRGDLIGVGQSWPHVVPVLRVVPVMSPKPATALVMPRMTGGTFAAVVAARGQLSPGELVTALSPVASALGALHADGLVHADVSPGNVLFDGAGRPALSDLGIARLLGDAHGAIWGSEGFLAPEVEAGQAPTPATDVYGIGALSWLALTGKPPGPACVRPPLAEVDPHVPEQVVELVEAALAADPHRRPSAAQLALDLFDAAPAAPLRLPASETDIAGLTQRIRSARSGPVQVPQQPVPRRRWRGTDRGREATYAARHTPSRPPRLTRPWAGRSEAAVRIPWRVGRRFAVAAVLLGVAGAVTSAALARVPEASGQSHAVSSTREAAAAQAVPSTGSGRAASPREVATDLLAARARLWTTLNVADLAAVDAPGSPAWRGDAELVSDAAAQGWSYTGVSFTVREATWQSREQETARLAVVYDSAPYQVSGSSAVDRRPGESGTRQVLDLVLVDGNWRVARVAS